MNRDANSGYAYNAQKDLLPLYGDISAKDTFLDTISKYAGVEKEEILSHDLFLYNRQKGTLWGANEEFLSATRLDDLQCCLLYTSFLITPDAVHYTELPPES